MASNELKARVSLDVSNAERKLNSLIKKIEQVNSAVKRTGAKSSVGTNFDKVAAKAEVAAIETKKIATATSQVAVEQNKVLINSLKIAQAKEIEAAKSRQELNLLRNKLLAEDKRAIAAQNAAEKRKKAEERVARATQAATERAKRAEAARTAQYEREARRRRKADEEAAKAYEKAYKKAQASILNGYKKMFKGILGIVGAITGIAGGISLGQTIVNTSDMITSAENKLNYMNGGDTNATQEQMDKMYYAALRSRSDYGDMMANVGKSMTIAPNAFGGNEDNAIAFQELMAKSYVLAGASQAESSQSMYQLIQSMGANKLQGDEMKSVMENAPLAYKTIEEYVQGIMSANGQVEDATKSLQELGSEGKVTGDMIVQAMLEAGDSINEAFENTDMTIAQAFTNIKSVAIKAFEPIQDTINEFMKSDEAAKLFNKLAMAIQTVVGVLNILLQAATDVVSFVINNWGWLRFIFSAVIILLALITAKLIELGIQALITGAKMLFAWLMSLGPIGLVIAAILALIAIFLMFTQQIVGAIWWLGALFKNIGLWIANVALGISGLKEAIDNNIRAAFVNTLQEIKARFWDFVAEVCNGIKQVADLANKLLGIFGVNIDTSGLESAIRNAESKAQNSRDKKLDYESLGDAWKQGYNTFDVFQSGWGSTAYNNGAAIGAGIQDGLKNALNITGMPDPNNPNYALNTTGGGGNIGKDVGKTADNTGRMADSMEMADEDLEYLRDLAEMEWKKEFTTANITVDMSNYNTINGDGDLDGIVTKLADKLYEELDYVANGTYGYGIG